MKKVVALMLGLALLAVIVTPQAEAAHGRGTAFFVGALTGALVAGAVASSYAYPAYYYSYPQPVVVHGLPAVPDLSAGLCWPALLP